MRKTATEGRRSARGSVDLLVLKTLALGPQHGWGMSLRIREISRDVFQVNTSSLYPALQRLEEHGWVSSEWGVAGAKRQAKFYRLTQSGVLQLERETANWAQIVAAMSRILETN